MRKYEGVLFLSHIYSWPTIVHIHKKSDQKEDDNSECVLLSLFIAFTNNVTKEMKLQMLISESKDCAVLDTDYSVCYNK